MHVAAQPATRGADVFRGRPFFFELLSVVSSWLAQDLYEAFGHPLVDDFCVHPAQLFPQFLFLCQVQAWPRILAGRVGLHVFIVNIIRAIVRPQVHGSHVKRMTCAASNGSNDGTPAGGMRCFGRSYRAIGENSMPKSQLVARHVPYLRRYARALTGNQASGNSYVAATLETLVREPGLMDMAADPRVALFQVFSRIWNSIEVNSTADRFVNLVPAERRLGQIAAMPRQAFLLISVEGFSEEDAAAILDVDQQTLQDLIEESGRELAAQIATDILIIEDEALIALDLENLVENLGHRSIGVARTRSEAIAMARTRRPGLILADIQLADGSSGLDAVNDMLNSFEVPVIFVTAYPERFLSGERPEPAFLVSKPYRQSTVSALVSQALFFERNAVQCKKRAAG